MAVAEHIFLRAGAEVAAVAAVAVSFAIAVSFAVAAEPAATSPPPPIVAGWIERVSLPEAAGLVLIAKLDTGADTSSIAADGIEHFERNGARYVRFSLSDDDGRRANLERPIVRTTRIKRAGAASDPRDVVRLPLCFAGQRLEAEFTLARREGLSTRVLIGRNVLEGRVLVDSSRRNVTPATCPGGR